MTSALVLTGASKSFDGIIVLQDAFLRLERGEIRALVGKNGSGKSTLIKILSGYHAPAPGAELMLAGVRQTLPMAPEALRRAGLAFVHQDLGLVGDADILDNMLVGRFRARGLAPIDWRTERERIAEVFDLFGLRRAPHEKLSALDAVERALVAIARAFLDAGEHGGVIVLDEPTVFLPSEDVERLFAAVRSIAAAGTAVLYVSHRLEEILSLTDTVTVLRDGRVVHEGRTEALDQDGLVRAILGEDVETFYPRRLDARQDLVLQAENLSGFVADAFSLDLRKGEVVGVTGLAGSGYEEVPYLLSGALASRHGKLRKDGRQLAGHSLTVPASRALGIALLPADRQKASGAQTLSVLENVALPVFGRFFRGGRIRQGAMRESVANLLQAYGVRPADPDLALRALSGGNQQKALLAKWMQTKPDVLLLHEPTQGVDVGAKHDIYARVEAAAGDGFSVVIASAETADLARICHRVLVMRRGAVVADLSGDQLTEQAITDHSFRNPVRPSGEHVRQVSV